MAELLLENWWPISLAIAVAIITAVVHRVCANIAFETSYRKGFFTQGAPYGIYLGVIGVLFVSTWRQIEAPNLTNQQQLEACPDDGDERWEEGLGLITLGLGVLVYQLMAVVFLHNPAIGSYWFWLAALALFVTGWFALRGGYPSYGLMPPLHDENYLDPPELLEMAAHRYEWGKIQLRSAHYGKFGIAAMIALIVALLAGIGTWFVRLPVGPWVVTGVSLAVALAAGVVIFFVYRRNTDLEYEARQVLLKSAPTPRHRKLMELQYRFFDRLENPGAFDPLIMYLFLPPAVVTVVLFIIALATGRSLLYWLAGAGLLVSIIALAIIGNREEDPVEEQDKRDEEELQELADEINELVRELEVADLEAARQASREEVGEVYSFELGHLISRGRQIPEAFRQQALQSSLDDELRAELDRDRQERATGFMTWASYEMEYLGRLRATRVRAFWAGLIVLALMAGTDILGFTARAVEVLEYTALGCFVLALASYLPEKFLALRDPSCLNLIGKAVSLALVGVVLWALIAGKP